MLSATEEFDRQVKIQISAFTTADIKTSIEGMKHILALSEEVLKEREAQLPLPGMDK